MKFEKDWIHFPDSDEPWMAKVVKQEACGGKMDPIFFSLNLN